MAQYDRAIDTALKLIAKFGGATTLDVYTNVEADPSKPWLPGTPTKESQSADMAWLNFSSQSNATGTGERFFEGSLIQQGDKKVLLAAEGLAFDPVIGAELTRGDGSVWTVVQLKLLDPNGQKVLWTMQARR